MGEDDVDPDEGGESACYANLVCLECGAVTSQGGHRPKCSLAEPAPLSDEGQAIEPTTHD